MKYTLENIKLAVQISIARLGNDNYQSIEFDELIRSFKLNLLNDADELRKHVVFDYQEAANEILKVKEPHLGCIDTNAALVILHAMANQDVIMLRQISKDFPIQWDKYHQRDKDGMVFWRKEGMDALVKKAGSARLKYMPDEAIRLNYKRLADKIRELSKKPLGNINKDVAIVLIAALVRQDISMLLQVKRDFASEWSRYYQKNEDGTHSWNEEGMRELRKLAETQDTA